MTGSNQPAPMTSLGDDGYARTIDRLREIGVADHVALPQLVVVGDQSSGKSSVLESVTGFAFPRAPELCTRYATQITCRRDDFENVVISIIPAANSSNARKETLLGFRCSTGKSKANKVMGIRQKAVSGFGDGTATFAEDTLKIEISGPNQNHLTVIDVPGIFRTATSGWTTDEDIVLVKNMVQSYMKSPRTIILAVVPCNVDIATQEILTMAQAFDPEGVRTMGVLTKPDLAIERAMQQIVCELVEGKRFPLRLGYCVVKNRGSDDNKLTLGERNSSKRRSSLYRPGRDFDAPRESASNA
ncbi:hypothetical protein CGMCC3_g7655 [Colletotrichum fructicola]|nr:uncharacterized protein CGMCC3_g7655 [Colletotrichum fructicola]KAE9576324.1 hypothetical protein CGMCC3_g7655 [Colletotrichum fructicola]